MPRQLSKFFIFFILCWGQADVNPLWANDSSALPPAVETYNKAVRLYEKSNWNAAKEYFHQYLAEYSDTPLYITCLYYLAICYQHTGDTKQAILLYHKVMDGANGADAFWGDMAQRRLLDLGEE